MNFSELKPQICSYLGFRGVSSTCETDALIGECLGELDRLHRFRYRYERFGSLPAELCKAPYLSFFQGCTGVILSVMTLGAEVDRRIRYLSRTDMTRSVVFDACASALLERLSDDYEKTLGDNLTYRFCPGYGGSDVKDVRVIFERLKPEKIGVSLTEGNYMVPSKSMAGIIGVGANRKKSCGGCFLLPHCEYRKAGVRCYDSDGK